MVINFLIMIIIQVFQLVISTFLSVYLFFGLHEFGHALVFKLNKISIKSIYFLNILFIKHENKMRLILTEFRYEGKVIPTIGIIENEKEFNKMKKIYRTVLLGGPIITYIYFIFIIGLYIILINTLFHDLIKYSIGIIFFLIFMDVKSNIKDKIGFSDYRLYNNIKAEDKYLTLMLYQNIYYNDNYLTELDNSMFLKNKLILALEQGYKDKDLSFTNISILILLLIDLMEGRIGSSGKIVTDYIEYIVQNLDNLPKDSNYNELLFEIIRYYIKIEKDEKLAKQIYLQVSLRLEDNTYHSKLLKNIFNIKNNDSDINDLSNYSYLKDNIKYYPGILNKVLSDLDEERLMI